MTQLDEKALEAARNQFDNIRQFGGNVVEGVIAAYLAALATPSKGGDDGK